MGIPKILCTSTAGQPMHRQGWCRQRESAPARGAITTRPTTHRVPRTIDSNTVPALRDDSFVADHGMARSGLRCQTRAHRWGHRHDQGRVLAMPTNTDACARIGIERVENLQCLEYPPKELPTRGVGAERLVDRVSDARRAFSTQAGMADGGRVARGEVR